MRLLTLIALICLGTPLAAQEAPLLLPPVLEAPPPLDLKTIPSPWSGGAELGLNGAQGNSDNFKMRAAGNVKREDGRMIWKSDWLYTFATQNSIRSENRALLTARQEWILPKASWSLFVSEQGETDEFKAYDLRLQTHTGFAYNFVKNKNSLFKGRLGVGGSQEFGGPNKKFMWEGLAGIDVEHRFNERYKIVGTGDYFPDFGSLADFRLQAKLSLEVLIDPVWNLTLKVGVLDRYDSTPEGKLPNDAEYFAALLWKF